MTMKRQEREDLERLSRDRQRLAKSAADARAAELKAEFEAQMAAQFSYDQNETWKQAYKLAEGAMHQAQAMVARECAKLGIPPEFSPGLNLYWYKRGENSCRERRDELRRVAYTRIEAMTKEAKKRTSMAATEWRVQLLSGSLESEETKESLKSMPTAADLMPKFTLKEIELSVKDRDAERQRMLQ